MSASAPESPLRSERGQPHQPELIWRDEKRETRQKETKAMKPSKIQGPMYYKVKLPTVYVITFFPLRER